MTQNADKTARIATCAMVTDRSDLLFLERLCKSSLSAREIERKTFDRHQMCWCLLAFKRHL